MNGVWLLLLTTAGLAELNSDYMLLTMFLLQHESRLEEKTPRELENMWFNTIMHFIMTMLEPHQTVYKI